MKSKHHLRRNKTIKEKASRELFLDAFLLKVYVSFFLKILRFVFPNRYVSFCGIYFLKGSNGTGNIVFREFDE